MLSTFRRSADSGSSVEGAEVPAGWVVHCWAALDVGRQECRHTVVLPSLLPWTISQHHSTFADAFIVNTQRRRKKNFYELDIRNEHKETQEKVYSVGPVR